MSAEAWVVFVLFVILAGISGGSLAGASFFIKPVDGIPPPSAGASCGAGCIAAALFGMVAAFLIIVATT